MYKIINGVTYKIKDRWLPIVEYLVNVLLKESEKATLEKLANLRAYQEIEILPEYIKLLKRIKKETFRVNEKGERINENEKK